MSQDITRWGIMNNLRLTLITHRDFHEGIFSLLIDFCYK